MWFSDSICGLKTDCDVSPYHLREVLNRFSTSCDTSVAERTEENKDKVTDDFNIHGYKDLGDFHDRALGWTFPKAKFTPVCYGGTFALPAARLINLVNEPKGEEILKRLEEALKRGAKGGATLEEHFVERTWASLLSKPLIRGRM